MSTLHTVRQFAEKHPAFTVPSLRSLIFRSIDRQSSQGTVKGNGLDVALVRIGRKVMIDEAKFLAWVHAQGEAAVAAIHAARNGGGRHV